ncbi:hypothetical protein LBMAG21_03750 [Armatimonadota bacterium]|nr:hypothetical protein LBMAG21_03750 [Armatimonadota bacterium]
MRPKTYRIAFGITSLAALLGATLCLALAPPVKNWAFQPPKTPPIPKVKNTAWVKNPIDAFLLAKLEANGLAPARPADKPTLLRRVTFDLTGLPPTPDEQTAFLNDTAPNAYERVIDRLLASPRYGERWGRRWLDVARYADSLDRRDTGTIRDFNEMWKYRDWVINAFNNDLTYDKFVTYQIAGDTLPASKPGDPNIEGTIATGLLAVGHWSNGDADKVKMLTDIADDQIDVVSRGFMGLTIACARCHDHKFDPITTRDYYGLAGIFLSSHVLPRPSPNDAVETPLRIPLVTQEERKAREAYFAQLKEARKNYERVQQEPLAQFANQKSEETARYLLALWEYHHRPANAAKQTPEEFAKERGLIPYAFRNWQTYLLEGNYPLLKTPVKYVDGYASIYAWTNEAEGSPALTLNGNMAPRTLGSVTYPSLTFGVSPGQYGIVIAWRSPIEGYVQVNGGLQAVDRQDANVTRWNITRRTPAGEQVLTRGTANHDETPFRTGVGAGGLSSIAVHKGDTLQFKVFPNADSRHQTLLLDLTIAERDGKRAWNLLQDTGATFLLDGKGNPHADGQGNPDVWSYHAETKGRREQETGRAIQTALRRWEAAFQEPNTPQGTQERREASAEVQTALSHDNNATPFWITDSADWKYLAASAQQALSQASAQIEALEKAPPPPIEYANGAQEGGCPLSPYAGFQDAAIYKRGNYQQPGEVVPRRFPTVLAGENQPPITQGSGRLQLAQWLVSPKHPLTARVFVNRVWQGHFGEGIVRTANNFGLLGEPPTHPGLLDWLATEFIRTGWSIKKLHKLILLSNAYQQSSQVSSAAKLKDADNRLLSRMARRRLEAEAVRDSLLFLTGSLNTTVGGVGDSEALSRRRTVYLLIARSDKGGFCPIFDGADPTTIIEKRNVSTVAPQALFLLNNDFTRIQAGLIVERLQREAKAESTVKRIQRLYLYLFGRDATHMEIGLGEEFLSSSDAITWREYTHLLLCTNEFVYVD